MSAKEVRLMVDIVIFPAIIMGIIIGMLELLFVHSDEGAMGMTWLTHGLHAIPFTILFVFVSMNISFVLNLLNLAITENFAVDLAIRGIIAIIAMVKVAGAAAITPGAMRGVGEKLPHTLIIGAFIFAAPYIWEYALAGIIGPMLPF
ncbi:hypothetical protein KY320_00285 [Candidatus Woesearchaeota archaeon]|nr:hypothetical protein [Candidatus Woesearchaeota archaeon]